MYISMYVFVYIAHVCVRVSYYAHAQAQTRAHWQNHEHHTLPALHQHGVFNNAILEVGRGGEGGGRLDGGGGGGGGRAKSHLGIYSSAHVQEGGGFDIFGLFYSHARPSSLVVL